MKRVTLLLMALALTFGLVHCKKQETNGTTSSGGIYISVKVEQDNGAKHDVHIPTGAVTYSDGDVILVGNGGHYIGQLTYQDGLFSGEITDPSTSDYLHFYFVSGLQPNGLSAGSTTEFNVDISDQRDKLLVLSYGHSRQRYSDANDTYSCVLENQCGLVKFVPSIPTLEDMTLQGVKTTATISFADNSIVPTDDLGNIDLYSESNAAKWAVLLPQEAMPDLTAKFTQDYYKGTVAALPAVTPNMFYTAGVPVAMKDLSFSFGTNQHCIIAKSNLRYKYHRWSFFENAYDCMRAWGSPDEVYLDLFGWGTWFTGCGPDDGTNDLADHGSYSLNYANEGVFYYNFPYSYNNTPDYLEGRVPAILGTSNYEARQFFDFRIGDEPWHVMSISGVFYLLYERGASTVNGVANARFSFAVIDNQYRGLIIFPDHYTHPAGVPLPSTACINNGAYGEGVPDRYTMEQWNLMEAEGVVFLPSTTGIREGETVSQLDYGYYWTNTRWAYWWDGYYRFYNDREAKAAPFTIVANDDFIFAEIPTTSTSLGYTPIHKGCAIRLIRDVDYK